MNKNNRTVPTFCRICEPACGLIARVENGEVVKLEPDKQHPVHKGFACHKGLNFLEVHNDPDRLDHPLRRVNSRDDSQAKFEATTWDQAITDIAARISAIQKKHGDNAIAGFFGNPTAFSSTAAMGLTETITKLGSQRMFSSSTQDCANKVAASEAVFGTFLLHPIPDLLHTDYFLCIGGNPKISHMSFVHTSAPMQKIRAISKRGGKTVFINPRKIESSTPATGDVLQIKPDTDVYFLAAVINHIIQNKNVDQGALEKHGRNFDGLSAFVHRYPPERVAQITGISTEDIRTVADDFSQAKGASVHMSTGVNMGRQGTLAYWLLNMLSLVTGNLGRVGGNLYSPGFFSIAKAGKSSSADRGDDSQKDQVQAVGGVLPGNLLADYIDDENEPIRALVINSGNPLLSVGGELALRQAFKKLELLVVIDIYRNATGELADFVLPATDWLERADVNSLGLGFQLEPFAQYSDAVIAPKAQRKPEWWILARLQQALGFETVLDNDKPNPFAALDHMLSTSDLSIAKLKGMTSQASALPAIDPAAIFDMGVQHDDGKIDCCPATFSSALDACEVIFEELNSEHETQLKLINLRTNYMHNSWLQNMSSLKRGIHAGNPLWMSPLDADKRKLSEGENIIVSNSHGEIEAQIAIDPKLRLGVVAMTHGLGNEDSNGMTVAQAFPGVNVNRLLPTGHGSYDPLSNQSHMTGIKVDVRSAR